MTNEQLSQLERVRLRDVWENEAFNFTPWLAEPKNIRLLSDVIGLDLEVEAQEKSVGPFSADILCRITGTDHWVLIENQLERTDHTHLGQLITYAAGLDAVTIVWIAATFTDEHRAAIDWMNKITSQEFSFFGLEVELWRIGDSPAAPKFNIISQPNDWSRSVSGAAKAELTEAKQTQLTFWTRFSEFLVDSGSTNKPPKPRPDAWIQFPSGNRFAVLAIASHWNSATNSYEVGELRVELGTWDVAAHGVYEKLREMAEEIESTIAEPVTWHDQANKARRIYVRRTADLAAEDQWPEYFAWLKERIDLFQQTFKPLVAELTTELANGHVDQV